jgi:peptidoglycan L-alanyl-D-glutamate endopeptidase CwlK
MKQENLLKRINLTVLYPPFRNRIEELVANLRTKGLEFWAVSGERTFAEQGLIYAQGRTRACPQCAKTGSKCTHIISKARPGWSLHNYGIAVDFCKDRDTAKLGLQPNWDTKEYLALGEAAKAMGLEAGVFWPKFVDAPHIQLPLGSRGLKIAQLLEAYNRGGKPAVFHLLDQYRW